MNLSSTASLRTGLMNLSSTASLPPGGSREVRPSAAAGEESAGPYLETRL